MKFRVRDVLPSDHDEKRCRTPFNVAVLGALRAAVWPTMLVRLADVPSTRTAAPAGWLVSETVADFGYRYTEREAERPPLSVAVSVRRR